MKRKGFIYERLVNYENCLAAVEKAAQHKHHRAYIRRALANKEGYAKRLFDLMQNESFSPAPYHRKTIQDGPSQKVRQITTCRFFPDQCVHTLLIMQTQDIFLKSMYRYCVGSVPGRGISFAHEYLKKVLKNDRKNTRYCLKLDIRKFYDNIDSNVLKALLRRKIKDARVLALYDLIIDSAGGTPIGLYTSQWLSNFYLEQIDHFIKETLHIPYYVRYVDDMVLLSANKRKLRQAREAISLQIKALNIELKQNWQVFRVDDRSIDFLGFRYYHGYTKLRKALMYRATKQARKVKRSGHSPKECRAMMSYMGWLKNSNSKGLYLKRVKPFVNFKRARTAIRTADAKHRKELTPCQPTKKM